jgi:hypothetical protein
MTALSLDDQKTLYRQWVSELTGNYTVPEAELEYWKASIDQGYFEPLNQTVAQLVQAYAVPSGGVVNDAAVISGLLQENRPDLIYSWRYTSSDPHYYPTTVDTSKLSQDDRNYLAHLVSAFKQMQKNLNPAVTTTPFGTSKIYTDDDLKAIEYAYTHGGVDAIKHLPGYEHIIQISRFSTQIDNLRARLTSDQFTDSMYHNITLTGHIDTYLLSPGVEFTVAALSGIGIFAFLIEKERDFELEWFAVTAVLGFFTGALAFIGYRFWRVEKQESSLMLASTDAGSVNYPQLGTAAEQLKPFQAQSADLEEAIRRTGAVTYYFLEWPELILRATVQSILQPLLTFLRFARYFVAYRGSVYVGIFAAFVLTAIKSVTMGPGHAIEDWGATAIAGVASALGYEALLSLYAADPFAQFANMSIALFIGLLKSVANSLADLAALVAKRDDAFLADMVVVALFTLIPLVYFEFQGDSFSVGKALGALFYGATADFIWHFGVDIPAQVTYDQFLEVFMQTGAKAFAETVTAWWNAVVQGLTKWIFELGIDIIKGTLTSVFETSESSSLEAIEGQSDWPHIDTSKASYITTHTSWFPDVYVREYLEAAVTQGLLTQEKADNLAMEYLTNINEITTKTDETAALADLDAKVAFDVSYNTDKAYKPYRVQATVLMDPATSQSWWSDVLDGISVWYLVFHPGLEREFADFWYVNTADEGGPLQGYAKAAKDIGASLTAGGATAVLLTANPITAVVGGLVALFGAVTTGLGEAVGKYQGDPLPPSA